MSPSLASIAHLLGRGLLRWLLVPGRGAVVALRFEVAVPEDGEHSAPRFMCRTRAYESSRPSVRRTAASYVAPRRRTHDEASSDLSSISRSSSIPASRARSMTCTASLDRPTLPLIIASRPATRARSASSTKSSVRTLAARLAKRVAVSSEASSNAEVAARGNWPASHSREAAPAGARAP